MKFKFTLSKFQDEEKPLRHSNVNEETEGIFKKGLLVGKNVLITGAGRNIGESIALEMGKQGANIYFVDIDNELVEKVGKNLGDSCVVYKGFCCDVTNLERMQGIYEYLSNNNINIEILINNVGIQFQKTKIDETSIDDWKKIFDVNVFSPMEITKNISMSMIKNKIGGSIIFITSIHQWTISGWPSYSSSKAALGMIINELAINLARYNIRVNGIAPGWVAEDHEGNPRGHRYTPLYKSSITPRYIGRAAVYLASDYFSRFTTGAIIKIDGGLSLHNYRAQQVFYPEGAG